MLEKLSNSLLRRHLNGETPEDRAAMLVTLSCQIHPESVPINALVAVEGTPMED